MLLDGLGPVRDAFLKLKGRLHEAAIPHIFLGATALNAHGFRRTTEDVDLCLRPADLDLFRRSFVGALYQPVEGRPRKFFDPAAQVSFDILVAGEIAGNTRKQREVRFPDPSEAVIIEDTPVPTLARLVELKLVTWRFKDWGDVVELIRIHALDEAFAEKLHPVVRSYYMQCYDQRIEEDRSNPESRG